MHSWKKVFYTFNRQEKRGIFYLLLALFILKLAHYGYFSLFKSSSKWEFHAAPELYGILPLQNTNAAGNATFVRPFNPNYIDDFKGYILGLSAAELDRLYQFRAEHHYLNSAEEFQQVTGISDSLLAALSPRFRFPEFSLKASRIPAANKGTSPEAVVAEMQSSVRDLNSVTAGDLRQIKGIGPVLSERIVRFRKALGGFLEDAQLFDVYGLDSSVATRVLGRFRVMEAPTVSRISINTATEAELANISYISYDLARQIVKYREQVGAITSFDQLLVLKGLPSGKIDRIKLYLTLF